MPRTLTNTQWKIAHKAVYACRNRVTSLVIGVVNKDHAKHLAAEFGYEYTANIASDDQYHWLDLDSLGTDENRIYIQNDDLNPEFGKGYYLDENNNITIIKHYMHQRTKAYPNIPFFKIIRKTQNGDYIDTQNEWFSNDREVWKGSNEPWDLCERLGFIAPRLFSYRDGPTDQCYAHIPNVAEQHNPEAFLISIGKG
tara:strand:+ start:5362 stop:5952 length:591 start_codon:yes stop_codon:yes gene_type:complete